MSKFAEIRTSKRRFASRARTVNNERLFPDTPKLVQWNFTYTASSHHGDGLVCAFRSIVKRQGLAGWWLDKPYFCASGPHHYRRLPARIVWQLRVALLRGHAHHAMNTLRDQATALVRTSWRLWHTYRPAALLAARNARKQWSELGL